MSRTRMHRFRVYGLNLHSTVPIDGLSDVHASAIYADEPADCEVAEGPVETRAGSIALDSAPYQEDESGIHVARHGESVYFAFADGTRFRIDGGRAITTTGAASPEDMASYLLGPILAFVLRDRGTLALHASAVTVGDGALLFCGPSGIGKSTTASAFIRAGAAALTDDVAAIEWRPDGPYLQPGYARLRLWDDSASALFGSPDALPRLTPTWEKRYFDASRSFHGRALPVRAVALLVGRHDAPTTIRPLSGHEAFARTLAQTSLTALLSPSERARELEQVIRLVNDVRILEVWVRDAIDATEELVEALTAAVL